MGIYSCQSNQFFVFNSKKLFIFLSIALYLCSHIGYFLITLANHDRLGESFFATLANIGSLVAVSFSVWRMPHIFYLIDEKFIEFIECSK